MKDRNERMMAVNYNNTLNAGFSTIQSRFNNKQLRLHEEFEGILSAFPDKNSCQDHSTLQQMNTSHCLSVVRKNHNAIFNRMGSVIRAEKDLIELSKNWEKVIAFHKLRDKSMAENIYSAIGRTRKSKYVVVVGLMHLSQIYRELTNVFAGKSELKLLNEIKHQYAPGSDPALNKQTNLFGLGILF